MSGNRSEIDSGIARNKIGWTPEKRPYTIRKQPTRRAVSFLLIVGTDKKCIHHKTVSDLSGPNYANGRAMVCGRK
jgi:hypothetical protein